MKKILIEAYSKANLGDDIFIKILCDRYPKDKLYIFTMNEYSKSLRKIKNLNCICYDRLIIRLINCIFRKMNISENFIRKCVKRKMDAVIYIGGSLFVQKKHEWKYSFYNTIEKKINGKPFFIIGANFGPYTDKEYYKSYKSFFEQCEDVCFRDRYFYNEFKSLSNVRYGKDIVFGYIKKNDNIITNSIVISVIKPSFRKNFIECIDNNIDDLYYKKISELSIEFIKRGYRVILMSFCKFEGDEEAIKYILEYIPKQYKERIKKYYYHDSIEEAINIIGNSKGVIATRFHSMILAINLKKAFFPIIYSEKMKNVLDDLDLNIDRINLYEIMNLDINKVVEEIDLVKIDESKVEKCKIDALKHFKKIDEFIME